MAACVLDGEKLCEVSGEVKWSNVERYNLEYCHGSLALYKLSTSFYIHGITKAKRVKFLLKPDKFSFQSRESRLTLSFTERGKSAVSMHLREAEPNQLRAFIDVLNNVKAYNASFKGKLISSSSKGKDIENAENLPLNNIHSNASSPRGKYESPLRRNLMRSSPSARTNKLTPSVQRNLHAKQMNPPSSNRSPNKTPLVDKTFARDNLSNTSSGGKSVTSFYGSQNLTQSPSEWKSAKNVRGPGLMPAPQTIRLTSQISFRSREKLLYERDFALTGFSNLGNTCYMNAILQSLLGLPPFVQDLSNRALLENVLPHCLYKCLHSVLMCKRKCGNPEVLKNCLRKLKRTISEAATRFSGYHQHDAHEFLCQVFDQLKDDVSKSNSPSSKDTSSESNPKLADSQCPVTRSFESGVVHTVICKQCGESAPKEEIYHAFSLDIPVLCNSSDKSPFGSAVSMQTLLEKHFEDEQLEYSCGKCESKEAIIAHSFSRLPRVLILHLKRYGFDNFTEEQAKKQDKVKIERFINLSMLCSSTSRPPLPFQPKSSLKFPTKSGRKPQKRYLTSDEDDDDSLHFQPSPSVRRKLSHSFANENFSSTAARNSLTNTKNYSDDDVEVMGVSKLDSVVENDQTEEQTHESEKTADKDITKFDGIRHTPSLRNKSVLEGTEEEQMEWALAESAKSAEKESNVNKEINEDDAKYNTLADILSNDTKSNIGNCFSNPVSHVINQPTICEKDVIEVGEVGNTPLRHTPLRFKRIWEDTEEEQMKWALAESTKSAKKESMAKLNGLEQKANKNAGERTSKTEALSEDATSNFDSDDFNQLSDISDEDLVFMAQSSKVEEPVGLKGGAPITTAAQDVSHDLDDSCLNDTGNDKRCGEDSSFENGIDTGFVLKNSTPKISIKKRTGSSIQRQTLQRNFSLSKTPKLGKFEGDLFDAGIKEGNLASTNTIGSEIVDKSSWEVQCFSDEDMEKAINMSLQDQTRSEQETTEDEDLKRALQLSLQDFEGQELKSTKVVSPAAVDPDNVTEPTFEIDEREGKPSTHSYRLISIVSHLGTSSTSGHYISDVYDCKTKQWTSYDDSAATKVAEHSVRYKRQHSGYIFFYLYKQCVDAIDEASPSKENSQR